MIVSLGNLKRRHVYDVKLGDKNITSIAPGKTDKVHQGERLMYNGHQIWPDPKQMIATLVLDPEGLKGTKDYAIWKTVREVNLQVFGDPFLRFLDLEDVIDGYGFNIGIHNVVTPKENLCQYRYQANGADWLDFFYSDVKPGVGTVQPGDTLTLKARFTGYDADDKRFWNSYQDKDGAWKWDFRAKGRLRAFSFEGLERFNFPMFGYNHFIGYTQQADWMLPPWEGLSFRAYISKPKKKIKMHGRWTVTSMPDVEEVARYESNIGGDKRATSIGDIGVKYVAGATGMHVLGEQLRDGTDMKAWIEVLPVLDVKFKVKVKEVVTCSEYV